MDAGGEARPALPGVQLSRREAIARRFRFQTYRITIGRNVVVVRITSALEREAMIDRLEDVLTRARRGGETVSIVVLSV
jgi:hypothetical protein